MAIYISPEDFVAACPTAMMPDNSVFEAVGLQLSEACESFERDFSPEVTAVICGDESPLRPAVIEHICCAVLYEAIPQLDLVLTSTGFGVVSNENVAPASVERVSNLRKSMRRRSLAALDRILARVREVASWRDAPARKKYFDSLFWSASQLSALAYAEPTRDDLMTRKPDILRAELALSDTISPELLEAMIEAISTRTESEIMHFFAGLCRKFVGATVVSQTPPANMRRMLQGFLDAHLDDFAAYRDSQTYKANHFDFYENKKDDSCFFFG